MQLSKPMSSIGIMLLSSSLVFTLWIINTGAVSQQEERVVVRKPWPIEPVKVVAVKTKNKDAIKIDTGSTFEEDDDWLDGFTVTVFNSSDKTVTAMAVEMVFRREPGDTRSPLGYPLHFGPEPNSPEYRYRDPNKVIKPGKTADLHLSPENYKSLKRFFEQLGYPNSIKRVELEIRAVGFEDGSMIHTGTLFLQDPAYPNDPTKKIKVPEPGAQNHKIRSPPNRKAILTSISFLNASLTMPNLMNSLAPEEECRARDAPRRSFCSGEFQGCSVERDFLAPFQVGPNKLEFRFEPCQLLLHNEWHNCNQLSEVERFAFCASEIPCSQQFETCLTSSDCCDGLYCNSGRCESCNPACTGEYVCVEGLCSNASPILIDVVGDGFDLTDASSGVNFDLNGDGLSNRISWTSPRSDDAWLSLDRNSNGVIESGKELFGDNTLQPNSSGRNGFLALAEFDKAKNGGNADGRIDSTDAVFFSLRLWRDSNHNGISERAELFTLPSLGVSGVDLNFKESRKTDEFGNQFRYRAKVFSQKETSVNRWAWDVFLLNAPIAENGDG